MSALTASAFHTLPGVEIREHEPMSLHTSFRLGGPADILALPQTLEGLRLLLIACHESGLPHLVIGNGTNLIVRDGGIRGVVIKISENLGEIHREGCRIIAQSGAGLGKVCMFAADEGLGGLSFAAGIPGSIGGAVWMNAGANGGDIGQLVDEVLAYDWEGHAIVLNHSELGFAYRHSNLQDRELVVAQVTLKLCAADTRELHAELFETVTRRCQKQPVNHPSAGCIFKRPPEDFAGRLIEDVGGKGLRVGGAEISLKHAGFIVNTGDATAADVLELVRIVRERVHDKHGVWLEPEVRVVGED